MSKIQNQKTRLKINQVFDLVCTIFNYFSPDADKHIQESQ